MPLVRVRQHFRFAEAVHFDAHGGVRLVEAAVAEGDGVGMLDDQRRESGFGGVAGAGGDQIFSGVLELAGFGLGHAEL